MSSDDLIPENASRYRQRHTTDRKLSGSQLAIVVAMASIVPIIMIVLAFRFFEDTQRRDDSALDLTVLSPSVVALSPPSVSTNGELELVAFSDDIRQGRIHDIAVDNGRLWLGTGKGLVEFSDGGQSRQHRLYSDAPFEWVQDLALNGDKLAMDVMVAEGPTGGQYAGSHLLDTDSGNRYALGANVLDQVWLDNELWQRPLERMLVRHTVTDGNLRTDEVKLSSQLCSHTRMEAIGDELWLAQQGVVRFHGGVRVGRGSRSKEVPCGVLRFNPATGNEVVYEEIDGLNSGFARAVVGDAREIWVGHSIKFAKLSVLDRGTDTWRSARPYGSANALALSDKAVWLATPSGSEPLLRIDRQTENRKAISGVPDGYFVSTIAIDGDTVWAGLYRQTWHGSTFTIDAMLARYHDTD